MSQTPEDRSSGDPASVDGSPTDTATLTITCAGVRPGMAVRFLSSLSERDHPPSKSKVSITRTWTWTPAASPTVHLPIECKDRDYQIKTGPVRPPVFIFNRREIWTESPVLQNYNAISLSSLQQYLPVSVDVAAGTVTFSFTCDASISLTPEAISSTRTPTEVPNSPLASIVESSSDFPVGSGEKMRKRVIKGKTTRPTEKRLSPNEMKLLCLTATFGAEGEDLDAGAGTNSTHIATLTLHCLGRGVGAVEYFSSLKQDELSGVMEPKQTLRQWELKPTANHPGGLAHTFLWKDSLYEVQRLVDDSIRIHFKRKPEWSTSPLDPFQSVSLKSIQRSHRVTRNDDAKTVTFTFACDLETRQTRGTQYEIDYPHVLDGSAYQSDSIMDEGSPDKFGDSTNMARANSADMTTEDLASLEAFLQSDEGTYSAKGRIQGETDMDEFDVTDLVEGFDLDDMDLDLEIGAVPPDQGGRLGDFFPAYGFDWSTVE